MLKKAEKRFRASSAVSAGLHEDKAAHFSQQVTLLRPCVFLAIFRDLCRFGIAVGGALRGAEPTCCQTDSDGEPASRHGMEVWR